MQRECICLCLPSRVSGQFCEKGPATVERIKYKGALKMDLA